jgi:hypothetical protein
VPPKQVLLVPPHDATIGGFTFTGSVATAVHVPSVPVTVYTVELTGVTLTFDPVNAPGFQLYVTVPTPPVEVTVRLEEPPGQTKEGVATGDIMIGQLVVVRVYDIPVPPGVHDVNVI